MLDHSSVVIIVLIHGEIRFSFMISHFEGVNSTKKGQDNGFRKS